MLGTNEIIERLKGYFSGFGDDGFGAVYGSKSYPTSDLPESYIEILGNGPISTRVSQFGVREYNILLILNVRLNADGTVNTVREDYLLSLIQDPLLRKGGINLDQYHYFLGKNSMVYSGRDLVSGYSTKTININVKIY